MALNIRKVDLNNLSTYLTVVTNRQALEGLTSGFVQTKEDLENQVGQLLKNIQENDRALLLSKIDNNSEIYSSIYNGLIDGADIDLRMISLQMIQLGDTVNRITDVMNRFHSTIIKAVNDRISEITNIGSLSDSNFEFNGFLSDTFSADTNDYQLTDGAKNSVTGGAYRLGTFDSVSYIKEDGDAYIKVYPLNGDLTVLGQDGSVLSRNIEDAYSLTGFNEKDVTFIGKIAGEDKEYYGSILAIIINLPARRFINEISFSQFASSELEIVGIYTSLYETTTHEVVDWQQITNFMYDPNNKGRSEILIERTSAQSIMILLGQRNRRLTNLEINPDELAHMVRQIESSSVDKVESINKAFREAMFESGFQVSRKDAIVYQTPQPLESSTAEVKRFLDRLIQVLRPADTISKVTGSIYDMGLYSLELKYNEYRTFGIYESKTHETQGNILSSQFTKTDTVNDEVFIKYYLVFETLKKRLLGIAETRTSDIVVVDDSSKLYYVLDFYGKNSSSFVVTVNGQVVSPLDYTLRYGDRTNTVIVGVVLDASLVQYGNILKFTYDISDLDINYNTYTPSMVDLRKEVGYPNIKKNIIRDPISSNIVIVRNVSGDAFVPLALNSGIKRVAMMVSGEAQTRYLVDSTSVAFSRINSELYYPDVIKIKDPTDSFREIISVDSLETPAHDLFFGVIDEVVAPADIISTTEIKTKYDYTPGSVVVSVNGTTVFVDGYGENATDLKLVTFRSVNVYPDDDIRVSYNPLSLIEYAQYGTSNIASFNKSETKGGTDPQNGITLESYPFVDYRIINDIKTTGQWADINNVYSLRKLVSTTYTPMMISIGGRPARNMTFYRDNKNPEMDQFSANSRNYQFYVQGNKVFFNTAITEDIVVSYYTLGSRVKLRAELFRNDLSNQSNTPQFYDYGLLVNVQ